MLGMGTTQRLAEQLYEMDIREYPHLRNTNYGPVDALLNRQQEGHVRVGLNRVARTLNGEQETSSSESMSPTISSWKAIHQFFTVFEEPSDTSEYEMEDVGALRLVERVINTSPQDGDIIFTPRSNSNEDHPFEEAMRLRPTEYFATSDMRLVETTLRWA